VTRATIVGISGSVHGIYPVARIDIGLNEKSVQDIVNGSNGLLSFAILRQSIWARKAK
jgi:hypothetical protein